MRRGVVEHAAIMHESPRRATAPLTPESFRGFGKIVAMGRNEIGDFGSGIDVGHVHFPGLFNVFFEFAAVSFGIVMPDGFPGRKHRGTSEDC
jgi:hypothetical protein